MEISNGVKKILATILFSFILFSPIFVEAAKPCDPCDIDEDCPTGTGCVTDDDCKPLKCKDINPDPTIEEKFCVLKCIGGDPKTPDVKEGVCQHPENVVFCSPIAHKTFGDLIDAIIKFIFNIALVVGPLLTIVGAVYILTAGGDPKKVGTGKNIIIYTLIGLAIIMLARGLIAMIEEIIGVKIGG